MCFSNCETVRCPECPPIINGFGRLDPPLECTEQNYSGCGVDMGECPRCKKIFQVSFKVDKVTDSGWV